MNVNDNPPTLRYVDLRRKGWPNTTGKSPRDHYRPTT